MIDAVIDRFGLTRMPSGRGLPPARLHQHADCAEAAARITRAIAGKTIGVITGEVGTGKTVAIRAPVAGLDPASHTVIYIGNLTAGTRGILTRVVTAPGGRPARGTAALAIQAWNALAGEAAERGRTPVLILDLCRCRDYADRGWCRLGGRLVRRASGGRVCRHSHRFSRKARMTSGGWYRPAGRARVVVVARALSLMVMSAWM